MASLLQPGFVYWDGVKYTLIPDVIGPAGPPGPAGGPGPAGPTGPAGASGANIQNQGTPITNNPHGIVNYTGAGVVAADSGGGVATITITGNPIGSASGDLFGSYPAPSVVKIQGTPVSSASVANDEYSLVSLGDVWTPAGTARVVNVKNFGAKGNGRTTAADGTVSATQTAFSSASAGGAGGPAFQSSDVGKVIVIPGAGSGGTVLRTTIAAYVSAGAVTLAAAASTSVTAARAYWYTDDTAAIQAAVNYAITNGYATVAFTPSSGGYVCTSSITIPNSIMLTGFGGKVAGGVSGGYTNAPAIWHDFSGDLFVFNGTGGAGSGTWGKTTSGGGARDLRITQIFGSPSDATPRGNAIKIVGTTNSECPSWMQLEDLIIDEGFNSPWTWAMDLDGTAVPGIAGLSNMRISKVSTHTGAGANGALLLNAANCKVTDCEFHDVNGNISITGTDPGSGGVRSVGVIIIGGDCVNVTLDWASQTTIVGTQCNSITNTANTLGPNYIHPGQLTVPFVDLSSGSGTIGVWPDPIGQVNPSLRSSDSICLTSGQYYTSSHTQTGTTNLHVIGCVNDGGIFEIQTNGIHELSTGAQVLISGVTGFSGGTGPNGAFLITVVDTTHFTLQGSSFSSGTYVSGGIVTPTYARLIGLQPFSGVDECAIVPNADMPLRVGAAGGLLSLYGAVPVVQQSVTGHVMAGSAIAGLVAGLGLEGVISNGTTVGVGEVSGAGTSIAITGDTTSVLFTGSGSLTDMTGGVNGQIISITIQQVGASVTRAGSSGSGFQLSGSQNCTAVTANAQLLVKFVGAAHFWQEIARSTDNN